MERTTISTRLKEVSSHSFYCDNCGKYLGVTEEYEDGWYEELGECELSFHLPDGRYRDKKCLCDDCKEKYLAELSNSLKRLGFEKRD